MRKLLLLLALPLLAACSDDDPAGPDTSHVGTYELQSVNGAAVPVSFPEDGGTFEARDGTLTLNSNNTWAVALTFAFTPDGGETELEIDESDGTYTRTGNTINFTDEDEEFTGTFSGGNTVTIVIEEEDGEFTFVFQK